ncbi:MAG TPA: glyoxalase [Acidimicrobiia bacterium]|nr:glyoxalase [Acidimicrobiia bacterium]
MNAYLAALDVAGDADAWAEGGFNVDDDGAIRVGHVCVQTGVGQRGIAGWHLTDEPPDVEPGVHPNGVTRLDHLVVFTDDPARTTASYAGIGLDARRVREVGNGTTQTFFRAGEVIVEVVGPIAGNDGERFWGLALTVADLDACAALFGDRLGPVKEAVQPGRCIATLRHEACGLTVPIAFMSGGAR